MNRWIAGIGIVAAVGAAAATIGRVGRDTVPALDALPSWAGGRPDIVACERYVANGLAAPSTYRRISANRIDSGVLDQASFDKEAGITVPPSRRARRVRDKLDKTLQSMDELEAMRADLNRNRAVGHELRLRTVAIEYDAQNANGVPIRAPAICMFRVIDNALDVESLDQRVDRAGDPAMDAALQYLGREPRRRGTSLTPCCL